MDSYAQMGPSSGAKTGGGVDEERGGAAASASAGRGSWRMPEAPPSSPRGGGKVGDSTPSVPRNGLSGSGNSNGGGGGSGGGRFWEQLRAFRVMAMPYFRESCAGRWLFAIMVVLTLLNSAVRVVFSYLARDFWSALSAKDEKVFYAIMVKFLLALLLLAPINVFYRFQRQKLAIKWREWMTDRTMQLYYSNRVYYALERSGEIDNPDQRIAEDVRSFTEYSLSLFLNIVTSSIDLVCFSVILYSIRPQLFVAIIIFATVGTVATIVIGKKLIHLNFEKLRKEANFRYSLVRIRENAESIAFYAGEDIEGIEVNRRFSAVIGNMNEVNVAQRNLDFFTTFYNYTTWILPIVVVAPEYFAGNVEMGVVQQSASAFGHVLDDLSLIVNSFESLSAFSAGIDRLFQFMNAIKEHDPDRYDASPLMSLPPGHDAWNAAVPSKDYYKTLGTIELRQMSPTSAQLADPVSGKMDALSLTNLTLLTPDRKRALMSGLDLSLSWGENLLIVGPSGAGKSSLLRAIAGLWTAGSGSIERPADGDVYFLPQRPYCALGSLRDQLLYPSTERDALDPADFPEGHRLSRSHMMRRELSDQELLDVLEAVNLSDLPRNAGGGDPVRGLNAVLDWSNTLSLGEQQRLAFGRILINRPRLVIMDESTSALDVASEDRMYTLLKGMTGRDRGSGLAELTYISVGHRPTLVRHHDMKLLIRGGSNHSVERIDDKIIGVVSDAHSILG